MRIKGFLLPEIKSYDTGDFLELIGPVITQYPPPPSPPQVTGLSCSAVVVPGQDSECPETPPLIQVQFSWADVNGDLAGGKKCFSYTYPTRTGRLQNGVTCVPFTHSSCTMGTSGSCLEQLSVPVSIPVTVNFFLQDATGRSSNTVSCILSPPC